MKVGIHMKICPQCEVEMKVLNENAVSIARINKTPVPFLVSEGYQEAIHAILYVCPMCGLVQAYVEEEYIEHLKRL